MAGRWLKGGGVLGEALYEALTLAETPVPIKVGRGAQGARGQGQREGEGGRQVAEGRWSFRH